MLARSGVLHEFVIISVMRLRRRRVLWHVFYRVLCRMRSLRIVIAVAWRQIAVELFHTQVSQRFMSEEVLLRVVQKILRVWIIGMLLNMDRITRIPVRLLPKEASGYEHARPGASYNMKSQQSVESHTDAHGSCLQP